MDYFKQNSQLAANLSSIRSKQLNPKQAKFQTSILHSAGASVSFNDRVYMNNSKKSCLSRHLKYYNGCGDISGKIKKLKPEIHELPYELYPQNYEKMRKSKKQHWQQLIKNLRQRNTQRSQQKILKQKQKIQQCTFSPFISKFIMSEQEREDTYERLYGEAETKRYQKTHKQKEKEEQELAQLQKYKIKQINIDKWKILNKQKYNLSPLYQRLEKVIEEKIKNKMNMEKQNKIDYPFKPTIDDNSKNIMQKKKLGNVVDRLLDDYNNRERNKINLRQKINSQIQKQLTFTPSINPYILTLSESPKYQSLYLNRNKSYQYLNFIPKINYISALMTQDRNSENTEEKLFRLSNAPIIVKYQNIQQIEKQMYWQCSFNPQINQISKNVLKINPKYHKCKIEQQPQPTHKPLINEKSKNMSASKRVSSLENIKKKTKEKTQYYKKQEQYNKMKQCSFSPHINTNIQERKNNSHNYSINKVAGFDRFYNKIEKVMQKQKRKKQIQDKIFYLQKSYDLRMLKHSKNSKNK